MNWRFNCFHFSLYDVKLLITLTRQLTFQQHWCISPQLTFQLLSMLTLWLTLQSLSGLRFSPLQQNHSSSNSHNFHRLLQLLSDDIKLTSSLVHTFEMALISFRSWNESSVPSFLSLVKWTGSHSKKENFLKKFPLALRVTSTNVLANSFFWITFEDQFCRDWTLKCGVLKQHSY